MKLRVILPLVVAALFWTILLLPVHEYGHWLMAQAVGISGGHVTYSLTLTTVNGAYYYPVGAMPLWWQDLLVRLAGGLFVVLMGAILCALLSVRSAARAVLLAFIVASGLTAPLELVSWPYTGLVFVLILALTLLWSTYTYINTYFGEDSYGKHR